jgi:hypothetical protein
MYGQNIHRTEPILLLLLLCVVTLALLAKRFKTRLVWVYPGAWASN